LQHGIISLTANIEKWSYIMGKFEEFKPIFYPESVAVLGVSANENKGGNRFLTSMMKFGFKGKLYPIHPNNKTILGLETYPSVKDVPGPVDLVYISTPASTVPRIIEDCLLKGVPAVEIYTAGFSELNDEGRRLEQEIVALAKGRLRIIGPNCFGVYCPLGGITFMTGAKYPKESGTVALMAQSGGLTTNIIWRASAHGIRFSKVISYGNACDLNEADFLEYLASDPETKVIAAYIEGTKNGKQFFKIARSLAGQKPFIVWKGGLTQTGRRAVYSHTASLGGEKAAWTAFFKQTGAIPVDNLDALLDTTIALSNNPQGAGRRVALVGGGGAAGVAASDSCEKAGLQIPTPPPDITKQLKALFPSAGASLRNPFDVGTPLVPVSSLKSILETLLSWDEIDVVIVDRIFLHETSSVTGMTDINPEKRAEAIVEAKRKFDKPIMVVLEEMPTDAKTVDVEISRGKTRSMFVQSGISVFPTLERAVNALSNMCAYHERASELK